MDEENDELLEATILYHNYSNGICILCGNSTCPESEHVWIAADCYTPKYCTRCAFTEGDALGHDWVITNYDTPITCQRCGEEDLNHEFFGIITQPTDVTVPNGATAATTVQAQGEGLTYTWYFTSSGTATKFSKSSVTSETYSTTMSADRSGRQVYCVITDKHGNTVTTETVTLSMKEAITIIVKPQDAKVANGETTTVTVEAEGEGLTYTWYYANKGKTTFTKSSYTTNAYSTIMDSTRDGRRVYCKITDAYGNSVKTNTVTMFMYTPLVITQQPADVSVAEGVAAKTTVKVNGDGLKYAWYFTSNGSSTKFSKSSITGATYSTTMDASRNGRQVYCVITDKHGGSVTTNTVTLSMRPRTLLQTALPPRPPLRQRATA